jgi:predicted ABC-type ATPase
MVAGASEQPVDLSIPDRVLNPDEVARSIDPINPDRIVIQAARTILRQRAQLLNEGLNFAIETTLSGNGEMRLLKEARERGYHIGLIRTATWWSSCRNSRIGPNAH